MLFSFLLPDANIKTDVEPLIFLERLAAIAESSPNYTSCGLKTSSLCPDVTWLYLYPTHTSSHEGFRGEISWDHKNPRFSQRVRVEVRADHWGTPSGDANYIIYAAGLHQLTDTLLALYNRQYKSRRKLWIQKQESCFPKLSPRLQIVFQRFVVSVNRQTPHPLDMQRWYEFIQLAHRLHVSLDESELQFLLEQEKFSSKQANYFTSIYTIGRKLLKTHCPRVSKKHEEMWREAQKH